MLLRLAAPLNYNFPPCAFTTVIPDKEKCPELGQLLEWILVIMQSITNRSIFLRLVPAHGFSMVQPNDTTVMGLLYSNKADISPPYMTMTAERLGTVGFLAPIETNFGVLAYKDVQFRHPVALDFFKLYPTTIIVWYIYLIFLWILIALASKLCKKSEFWSRKLKLYTNFPLALFYGLLLGVLQSHVVIAFNKPVKKTEPFNKPGDLLKRLESKEYTAVVSSEVFVQQLLNPSKTDDAVLKRFRDAAVVNPPIVERNFEKRIEYLGKNGKQRFVLLGEKHNARDYEDYCGVKFFVDTSIHFGYTTIMLNPLLASRFHMDSIKRNVILKELLRLQRKHRDRKNSCQDFEFSAGPKSSVKIQQMAGAFWTLPMLYSLSILTIIFEIIFSYCGSMYRAKPVFRQNSLASDDVLY